MNILAICYEELWLPFWKKDSKAVWICMKMKDFLNIYTIRHPIIFFFLIIHLMNAIKTNFNHKYLPGFFPYLCWLVCMKWYVPMASVVKESALLMWLYPNVKRVHWGTQSNIAQMHTLTEERESGSGNTNYNNSTGAKTWKSPSYCRCTFYHGIIFTRNLNFCLISVYKITRIS